MDPMRLELDHGIGAPATARHALEAWICSEENTAVLLDDALLVVSELVTNVVAHTTSNPVVTAAFDDHRLRLEVHDSDPHGPITATTPAGSELGLRIVAAHCDLWGWGPTAFGKRVWTETLC